MAGARPHGATSGGEPGGGVWTSQVDVYGSPAVFVPPAWSTRLGSEDGWDRGLLIQGAAAWMGHMRLDLRPGDDGVASMHATTGGPTLIVRIVAHRSGNQDEEAGGPVARTARVMRLPSFGLGDGSSPDHAPVDGAGSAPPLFFPGLEVRRQEAFLEAANASGARRNLLMAERRLHPCHHAYQAPRIDLVVLE